MSTSIFAILLLSADGGESNGEVTRPNLDNIFQKLSQVYKVGPEDVFLDVGCSYNVVACDVAQILQCQAFGIEIVDERCYIGVQN